VTTIIGIDPGYSGAICIAAKQREFMSMPTIGGSKHRDYDLRAIDTLCCAWGEAHEYVIAIEAFASFGLGTSAVHSLVRCITAWESGALRWDLPIQIVKSQVWQKQAFEGTDAAMKPKARAKIACERLFGAESAKWTEGQRDAALIAWWAGRAA
jgi:hypothetical protein